MILSPYSSLSVGIHSPMTPSISWLHHTKERPTLSPCTLADPPPSVKLHHLAPCYNHPVLLPRLPVCFLGLSSLTCSTLPSALTQPSHTAPPLESDFKAHHFRSTYSSSLITEVSSPPWPMPEVLMVVWARKERGKITPLNLGLLVCKIRIIIHNS